MKIALMISSLGGGGAERVITILADEFARRGHEVTLTTFTPCDADFYRVGAAVRRVSLGQVRRGRLPGAGLWANARRVRRIRRALAAIGPDVIVSFVTEMNVLVLLAARGQGIPVVVSERVDPRSHDVGALWRRLRALTYPAARGVVVQTDGVAQWCREALDLVRTVSVIPNPLTPGRPVSGTVRASARPYVLAAGRLVRQKGFDLLLRAFARIAHEVPDLDVVIAGDGPERAALEQLCGALGLESRVMLVGHTAELPRWTAGAQMFVLPSRYEGFPNVLLEAVAAGVPCIAADCVSGPAEILDGGAAGLLVPREDVAALADAIAQLARSPQQRARLARAGVLAAARYSTEVVVGKWEQALATAVAR